MVSTWMKFILSFSCSWDWAGLCEAVCLGTPGWERASLAHSSRWGCTVMGSTWLLFCGRKHGEVGPDPVEKWVKRAAFPGDLNLMWCYCLHNRKGRFHRPGSWRIFLSNSAGAGESRAEPGCSYGVWGLRHPGEHHAWQWKPGGSLLPFWLAPVA